MENRYLGENCEEHEMKYNTIICANCVDEMQTWPANVIDLVVTSPPYDNLRDYQGFKFDFLGIASQLWRVTKPGGVVVWVVGDATVKGSETGTSFRQVLYFKEIGFNLFDTMFYQKNSFANPSTVRYHQVIEYMFILSKGKPKTFNGIKDRKNKWAGQSSWGRNTVRQQDGTLVERPKKVISEYGLRFNIWKYNTGGCGQGTTSKIAKEHPATFPDNLAEDHVISWSNPGDIVLDCMCGSGTVLVAAKKLNRKYIGIDISSEYCKLSERRLNE